MIPSWLVYFLGVLLFTWHKASANYIRDHKISLFIIPRQIRGRVEVTRRISGAYLAFIRVMVDLTKVAPFVST